MNKMNAIICERYGAPDVLKLKKVKKPIPKRNEILVKICATTVHVGDTRVRSFKIPRFFGLPARIFLGIRGPRNKILGMELAGVVETIGKDVTRFKVGDPVFTYSFKFGSYAEYKCVPENDIIAHKPKNMTFKEAAAFPAGAITALLILRKLKIQKGQNILIYGASGSVGTYATQLAKNYYQANVTGVCSTSNLNMVKTLGADTVIDYTQENFNKNGKTYDIVLDAVGKLSSSQVKPSLKKKGKYFNVNNVSGKVKVEDLNFLCKLVVEGKIKSVIDRTYSLEEIVAAHEYVDKGHKKGNVVITINHTNQNGMN